MGQTRFIANNDEWNEFTNIKHTLDLHIEKPSFGFMHTPSEFWVLFYSTYPYFRK